MTIGIINQYNASALGLEDGLATVEISGHGVPDPGFVLTDQGAPRPANAAFGPLPNSIIVVLGGGVIRIDVSALASWRRYDLQILDSLGAYARVPLAVGSDAPPTGALTINPPSADQGTLTNPSDSSVADGSVVLVAESPAFVYDTALNAPALGYGYSFQINTGRWYAYTATAPGVSPLILPDIGAGIYSIKPTLSALLAGTYTFRVRDAFGRETVVTFILTAPAPIFGAWAPVPYLLLPNQPDGVTALTTLRTVDPAGGPTTNRAALRATAKAALSLAFFNVAGFLQGLFPRTKPFSTDDWNGLDLVRYFTFNETAVPANDHPLRAVLDSGHTKAGLLPWATGGRLLTPFWRLLPVWDGYPQPVASVNALTAAVTNIDYTPLTAPAPFLLLPCPTRPVDIVFLGRCGGHGRFVFNGKHTRGVEVGSGETYYNAANEEFWSQRGRMADTVGVVASVKRAELADALEELRTSPVVWANRAAPDATPDWQRVIIEPESFATRRYGDKRFDISFTFRYAQALPVQGA